MSEPSFCEEEGELPIVVAPGVGDSSAGFISRGKLMQITRLVTSILFLKIREKLQVNL